MPMAGRTIEQGVSMLTAGEIRVAVLPVGPVPRDVLDEYLELINRYHHVSLSATRSFYRESTVAQPAAAATASRVASAGKTPFQFMDWSNSYMHLRFLQAEDARRRTRLPDLHPGRQVLAILGVVYCPMCASVQQAYDEFKKICRSYPEAFVARCFVFEPTEDHIRQERECQQLADLVMFPPGGPSHLEQHLEVWMHDLAAALLTELEKWMLTATPALMKLSGYADSAEFTGVSPVLDEMQKRLASVDGEMREKQRWGRLMKMKGDMCLLSGSPRDAAEHYRMGQEIAKACGDWVWYGSALEGIAAARLHDVITGSGASAGDSGGSQSSGGRAKPHSGRARDGGRGGGAGFMTAAKWELLRGSDAEAFVRECYTDARAAYKKKGGVVALQIEQHLKLARLVSGLRGVGARREVSELVGTVGELLPSLPAVEDRLVATVECAQVLGMVGCHRKRTLLLWHAMEQARAAGSEKGDLLRIAVRALEPPDDPQVQDPDDLPRTHWSTSRATTGSATGASRGWEAVHTVVLEATLSAAKQAHAPAEAWEAAATLLREHHTVLTPQYQAALLENLSQVSAALPSRHRTRPGMGPGPMLQLKRLLPAALPLQPAPLTLTAAGTIAAGAGGTGRGKGGNFGPFIFNPYAAKRQAKQEAGEANNTPDWACSDEGRVEVYLVNPLAVPLKIDQLQLHVKFLGHPGSPSPVAATLAPQAAGTSAASAVLVRGGSGRQQAVTGHGSSGAASGTTTPAHGAGGAAAAAAAAAASKAFKTPTLTMLLPPNGRPQRVVLCGKPQLPGTYSIEGCLVTSWGVSWHVPFTVPLKKLVAVGRAASSSASNAVGSASGGSSRSQMTTGGGPTAAALAAAGPSRSVRVNVLPTLPLVKAIIRASPIGGPLAQPPSAPGTPAASGGAANAQPLMAPQQHVLGTQQQQHSHPQSHVSLPDQNVVAISPRDDDIHAPPAHTAFAEDLQRSPPVAVFEGQRLAWSLTLQNMGVLAVTALSVLVTNHKGVALKPLRNATLPASFQGVHLEVDDTALQPASSSGSAAAGSTSPTSSAGTPSSSPALPLRPGCAVALPLVLAVGQAPRGTFREVSLEVTIYYLTKPSDRPASDDTSPVLGRRMTVNLTFEIQPSLSVASTSFLDHYAPLRNGQRLPQDRPIDLRVAAAATGSAAVAPGGGCDGGGDDSDSGPAGLGSRSASLTVDFSLGQLARPRYSSLTTASRSSLGGPSFNHGHGPSAGGGGSISMQQQLSNFGAASGLSARLAGLDLSLGGSRSSKSAAAMSFSMHSAFTSPLSPSAGGAAPWGAYDPRDGHTLGLGLGAPLVSITPQVSMQSQLDPATSCSPRHRGEAAAARSAGGPRSVMVAPEGPDDTLGLVTDSVMCVAVRNTSSYYYRAWLARLDDPSGSPPLTASAAAAADCPIEVLQPGDTARLACVLPSVAHAAVSRMTEGAATAAATSCGDDEAGGPESTRTSSLTEPSASLTFPFTRGMGSAGAGSSLRRVRLTIQPPGGGGAAAVDVGGGQGPDAGVADSTSVSGSGGSGGGAGELAEEADRMAAAEALAEDWAVMWELVTGLSETAAGRAPPRGMVRLAAVDIARSMSTTAVHTLRPSTVHFQFQALPPALPTAGAVPRLKDLTYRLQALGLLPPHMAGSVWGLRAQLGEVLRCDLLVHNRGSHMHHLTFSLAATNTACAAHLQPDVYSQGHHQQHHQHPYNHSGGHQYGQAPYAFHSGSQGHGGPPAAVHASSFQTVSSIGQVVPHGALHARLLQQHHHRQPHTFDGYTSGSSLALGGGPAAAYGRGATGASEMYGVAGVAAASQAVEPGIDPGVVVVGAVQNVHVAVEPRSTARHPFALTFAHPGLYQLCVYDVCVVPEGADSGLWTGRPGQALQLQRIYASVDRLNVLCV